ncbi:hypothetical protein ACFO4P_03665 [Epilithonimonas pallida]|uniref:Uncharacterized protein n=1 Tax=Epilithonimonas pallida TaxID=373671 RepID=A0ABY1R0A0_9FLAO|nr:hypothetical protein SAMN05421679_102465 [Epilithonimonas pallida]
MLYQTVIEQWIYNGYTTIEERIYKGYTNQHIMLNQNPIIIQYLYKMTWKIFTY